MWMGALNMPALPLMLFKRPFSVKSQIKMHDEKHINIKLN